MIIIGTVAAVVVVGAVLAWAVARLGVPGVPEPASVRPAAAELGAGRPVAAEDVRTLRFDLVVRGYRMDQVDRALEVLGSELAERDAEIVRLRAEVDTGGGHEGVRER